MLHLSIDAHSIGYTACTRLGTSYQSYLQKPRQGTQDVALPVLQCGTLEYRYLGKSLLCGGESTKWPSAQGGEAHSVSVMAEAGTSGRSPRGFLCGVDGNFSS